MALLSERQQRIVSLLASSAGPLTGSELAQELGVSVRTVQAEVARINGGGALIESSNRGYRLRRDPADGAVGHDGLDRGATPSDPADVVLRVLARNLVTGEEGPTAEDLGELLFMGRTAVERVLGEVRERASVRVSPSREPAAGLASRGTMTPEDGSSPAWWWTR